MRDRYQFVKGDRVRGSWDSATVVDVEGEGRDARVWIEWDPVDAAGVDRGPGRTCMRFAWTLTLLRHRCPGCASVDRSRPNNLYRRGEFVGFCFDPWHEDDE